MVAKKKSSTQSVSDAIAPIYVIYGKERRAVIAQVATTIEMLLDGADEQTALTVFDEDAIWADVHCDLCTLPFLSPRRIIVIRGADDFISKNRTLLETYMEKPSETGVLVLQADSFPGNTRLAKVVKKEGVIKGFDLVKPKDLSAHLTQYSKIKHGLILSRQAANVLIELTGDHAGMLENEIDKLRCYVLNSGGTVKSISIDDIEAVVGNNRTFNIFNVLDAMGGGKIELALRQFHKMLQDDKDAQYTVVAGFAWQIRRLYEARSMMENKCSAQQVIKTLRVWYNKESFISQVKRLNLLRLGGMIQMLEKIDYTSKTSSGDVILGMEKLIVRFCLPDKRLA